MAYRVRSTDVWFNMSGVVTAYQSIAAPDSFAARQNVAHGGARFGAYTATPGVLPTWSSAAGHTYNGSQYLDINLSPALTNWSFLVRYSDHTDGSVFGAGTYDNGSTFKARPGHFGSMSYAYGSTLCVEGAYLTRGVIGVVGNRGTINGSLTANTITNYGSGDAYRTLIIGGYRTFVVDQLMTGKTQAVVVFSKILSPTELWIAARQMTYCEQNPDWNAFARRRRYYYTYSPPPAETGSALAAAAGAFGIRFAASPHGTHSGPRRPAGPVGGHRGPLND